MSSNHRLMEVWFCALLPSWVLALSSWTSVHSRPVCSRHSRDTLEVGRQQLGWQEEAQQEEVGTQQAGLHTGRHSRDRLEQGLQHTGAQQEGWQQEEEPEQMGVQHTGLQQIGTQQGD